MTDQRGPFWPKKEMNTYQEVLSTGASIAPEYCLPSCANPEVSNQHPDDYGSRLGLPYCDFLLCHEPFISLSRATGMSLTVPSSPPMSTAQVIIDRWTSSINQESLQMLWRSDCGLSSGHGWPASWDEWISVYLSQRSTISAIIHLQT